MSLKQTGISMLILTVFVAVIGGQMCCAASYQGPATDHFDGSEFFYPGAPDDHSFTDMLRWMWEMETVDWPEWVEDEPMPAPTSRVDKGRLRATYVNHATVLIQVDGINILTDPIWSKRAGPVSWLGTKRVRAPGVAFEKLPKIDYVLLSHDHYDHLDLPTLKRLAERDDPVILAGLGLKEFLEDEDFKKVAELDWWDSYTIPNSNSKIVFVPAHHKSGRTFSGRNQTLWGGYVVDSSSGQIYFAGDTAFESMFQQVRSRFDRIRLSIFPIGSYEARWFMKNQHMNPDDAVKAHHILGSRQSMGMHYATFAEHPEQTIGAHEKDLASALAKYDVPSNQFLVLKFGEGKDVAGLE